MIKAKKILSAFAFTIISMNVYAEAVSTKAVSAKTVSTKAVSDTSASAPAVEADPTTKLLQQAVSAFMEKNKIPGVAVELYANGKLYEQYSGYADLEKKEPVIRKTIFELGSVSKIMTSVLFAQEIDWAKMSFNDPVSKYVKGLPEIFNKVKLQELATDTSGLPFNTPGDITTQDGMKENLSKWTPDAEPGEQWIYSNVGIGILGYALEASTERDYDDLYRRHILNPLRMVTGVNVPPALIKYYAQGYDANGNPAAHYTPGMYPAAVGVKASASDMEKFLSAAIGLPGTPPRVFYPMRMTQSVYVKMNDDYQGLGWQIHRLEDGDAYGLLRVSDKQDMGPIDVQEVYSRPVYNGDALIDKTGTTKGFRAYIAVLPNKKSGIVILANKNVPNSAIVKTGREILFKVAKVTS
jgi:beta-lactamase class C